MSEQNQKETVERIIRIIAKANPTFEEARNILNKVYNIVQDQCKYVGIGPIDNDSKMVDEIFSVFIEKPIESSEAFNIIEEVGKELYRLSDQCRFSVS